ncbi:DNA internalization-related competence protein ComEC/Rec2 [Desulfuromonas versatilis]|uniref:DNA internalization-related competence protein ComEC/Rec2 n=1 Tax=Desulfuromonas versatilis TaxID=2802975 RepID=A0ABM8HQT3_9BACT|nr:DNA internalization-related competence protein ComEC/Rec2 [Desulfuromonas versatilis]BCR04599.1 DNA internalization-related competence protein ComEC/Rec2 [Desulfuromonas versatilis]
MGLSGYLLAYLGGLLAAPWLPPSPWFAPGALACALFFFALRSRPVAALPAAAFFCLLGVSLYHLHLTPPADPAHVRNFAGEERVLLDATILSIADRPSGRRVLDLAAHGVGKDGREAAVHGTVRLYLDEGPLQAESGDRVRLLTRLRTPRAFGTPGEFDFPRHLAYSGVFATAHARHGLDLAVIPRPQGGRASFENARRTIASYIEAAVGPGYAPLVQALVIGEKSGISSEQRELLARGGVSHLFAISGLHLGMVAALLYAVASFFYRRSETLLILAPPRRLLPVLLLPLLVAYLALTGNALPTRRALLMAGAVALLLLFARRTQPVRLFATVALLILVAEPLALYQPAFQLSFAGLLGILLLVPRWSTRLALLPRPLRWPAMLFASTTAATLATTPLVLFNFHMLAPAGLITNLWAIPAVGFLAVPLGLAGALLLPWFPWGAGMLFRACSQVLQYVLAGVQALIELPLLQGWIWYLPPGQLLAIGLVSGVLLLPAGPGALRRTRIALLAAAALLAAFPLPPAADLQVTALSVGQGDSILVSRNGESHYLVDGGGLYSEFFDVGQRLVAPALGRLGVRSLDAVILTHDHPDHRKGLLHVLEHFPVARFLAPVAPGELDRSLQEVLARRQIPAARLAPGWTLIEQEPDRSLAAFVPARGSVNDRSIVLHGTLGRDGFLLTGDLEAPGVAELLASPPQGPVTLLKLPHHGSRRSTPELLLDRFRPHRAFVSAGAGNPYQLPHPEVLSQVAERGVPLCRTDREGTLRFRSQGEGWRVTHWERGLFR